jgi:hypothetical protein
MTNRNQRNILRNMVTRVKNDLHRTNNNVEGWHRKLNCAFQCSHSTLWNFLDKLIKENNVHSDIINAMTGRQPPVGKYESFNRRLKQLVENPYSNIYKQLTCIGRLLSLYNLYFCSLVLFEIVNTSC